MASIKDLRKRIVSTKNTQQTTKAMKMVSAAKLRRAQEAITNHRPYARRVGDLIRLVSGSTDIPIESPLMRKEKPANERKLLLLVVTSDRGLCGGFNASVIKGSVRWVAANQAKYASVEMGYLGRKGYDFFKTKKYNQGPYFPELSGKVTFLKARKFADAIVAGYLEGKWDEVKIVYNEFKNAVSQKVNVENFLPLDESGIEGADAKEKKKDVPPFLVKPDLKSLLEALLAKHFSTQTFRIMLESQASEHGARMSAMENATKNAGEMIRKLTLQYNKQRQAGITKELLEIISGAESQKNTE